MTSLRRRQLFPALAMILVITAVLVATIAPASAGTNTQSYAFKTSPGFCALAIATVDTNTHLVVNATTATATYNSSSCSTAVNWPSGDIANRDIYLWSGGICDQRSGYIYNPAPWQFTAVASNGFAICGSVGSWAVAESDSQVYVGFPASWVAGGVYSNPENTT